MRWLLARLLARIGERTRDYYFINEHRKRKGAFTRNRCLTFQKVVYARLDTVKQSNAIASYNMMRSVFEETPVSRQSFEEARKNIEYTAFAELFRDTVQGVLEEQETKLYKDRYRLLGVDGSLVLLPQSAELKEVYGKTTPAEGQTFCRLSICADLLNDFIFDGEIASFGTGERALAMRHLGTVTCENALFVFDRGYWSEDLVRSICKSGRKLLIRIPSDCVRAVTQSGTASGNFVYKGIKLRYYKFPLVSGEMEYLVTNLSVEEVSDSELKELYALRWGVETRYNELKNTIGAMRFSGRTELIVKQDFFAYLTVMNLIAAAVYDADALLQEQRKGKSQKCEHKPNKSVATNILKTRYLRASMDFE